MKKNLALVMIFVTTAHIIGLERKPANTPTSSPSGSITKQIKDLEPLASVFEPKVTQSVCDNNCICIECLNKAICELEKIQHKLPYLQMMVKSPREQQERNKTSIKMVGPQAMAAARMIAKLKEVSKESEKLGLLLEKAKDKSSKSEKKSKKEKKEHKIKDPNLKRSSSSCRRHRLTTQSDGRREEELNQLTDETQDNYAWRLKDAGLI